MLPFGLARVRPTDGKADKLSARPPAPLLHPFFRSVARTVSKSFVCPLFRFHTLVHISTHTRLLAYFLACTHSDTLTYYRGVMDANAANIAFDVVVGATVATAVVDSVLRCAEFGAICRRHILGACSAERCLLQADQRRDS